ncbi:hypothetical protein GCM10023322_18680 [Rugosimonospora acidiphila]|uniref:DUF4236 domain-containing protein n=1 Tax=Rugosimonospora acidiphila TaxID=556531 RepID=A0ABP9RPK8_9ACTN
MPLMFRKVYRLGPLHLNFGSHGLSSWSIKLGRWSWNSRTRAQRVDLPGPLSWRGRRGASR